MTVSPRSIALVVFFLAVAATGAASQDASVELARTLAVDARLGIFDAVTVRMEGDEAILEGKVTTPFKKRGAADHAARHPGVRRVTNRIDVLPASRADDELRQRVARAIYGHSTFWRYAAMADPPIHILVEHGRVTLEGVVQDQLERVLAQSLATGLGETSITNRLRSRADG